MVFVFIEILFKIVLFKGGVLIYAEHCIYIQMYIYIYFFVMYTVYYILYIVNYIFYFNVITNSNVLFM